MMKNIKYGSFGAGRAGQGQINLQNGEVVFVHDDTSPDSSVLPLGISHVYSRENALNSECVSFGRGFKLNLHQKLQPVKNDNPNGTRYELVDASGKTYEFEEIYYYRMSDGKREYDKIENEGQVNETRRKLTPKDIKIDYEGNLTYADENGKEHEIFVELKTDSGLILNSELKGFKDSEKIETRNEELIQMEEEIKHLERSIQDLDLAKWEYGKFHFEKVMRAKQDEMQKISLELELDSQRSFNETKALQDKLIQLTEGYNELIKKDHVNIGRLEIHNDSSNNSPTSENDVTSGNIDWNTSAHAFFFNGTGPRYGYSKEIGREMERLSLLASYDGGYTREPYALGPDHAYDAAGHEMNGDNGPVSIHPAVKNSRRITRVIQFLQERFSEQCDKYTQSIREDSLKLEKKRWDDQKALMELKDDILKLQEELQKAKDDYDDHEKEVDMDARYEEMMRRTNEDLEVAGFMLDYRNFVLKQYKEQMPVNYILDPNGMTYGFNEDGIIVIIWDTYGNNASLIYEENKVKNTELRWIIDSEGKEIEFEYDDNNGKLIRIVDTLDRRTEFLYGDEEDPLEKDELKSIVYSNGDESFFEYDNTHRLLYRIISPTGTGALLEYDPEKRPVRISAITTTKSITVDGIEKLTVKENDDKENIRTDTEDITEIEYGTDGRTIVSDVKTDHRTTYIFNSDGEAITEYTELDHVMKGIRTYDVGEKKCYFVMQQTDFSKDLMDRALRNGSTSPASSVVTIPANNTSPSHAEWTLGPGDLPEHATDLILSGFASADSLETSDRRVTEYCRRDPDHEHSTHDVNGPRFELRAKIIYKDLSEKEFIAGFDHKIGAKQFAAIPMIFDRDENGLPKEVQEIRIIADYSNNNGQCLFWKPSLGNGDWTYVKVDGEKRKIFESSNYRISDKTSAGVKDGSKFVTYVETTYDHDKKGDLIKEETKLFTSGIPKPKEYVTTYEYDKYSRPIRTTAPNGMVDETEYDEEGTVIRSSVYHKSNPASRFIGVNGENEKGQIVSEHDERGENRTDITYRYGTNLASGSTSPGGQKFAVGLDPKTDDLLAISASVNGEPNETKFVYTKGMLTRLTSNETDYDYEYDGWGRKTAINIANEPHVKFSFDEDRNNGNDSLLTTYANGEQYETVTDKFGKLLTVSRMVDDIKTPFITNQYDDEDRLIRTVDHLAEKVIEYLYNDDGSLNSERNGDIDTVYDYNSEGNVEKVIYTLPERSLSDGTEERITNVYENVYDEFDGKLLEIKLPTDRSEVIEYDELDRVIAVQHPVHKEKITYYQNGESATNIISNIRNGKDSTKYNYDTNGNISEIFENGKLSVRYRYDGINRLVREDNVRLRKTFTIDYDTNGNVLFKNTYPLTSANEPGFAHACRHNTSECDEYDVNDPFNCGGSSYEYMEEGNKDRLLEFNGGNGSGNGNGNGNGSFRYDVIGNPFEYRNKELKWDNLRNLASFGDIRFEYDASGIRTIKHSDGSPYGKRSQWSASETRFLWAGDRLLGERRMSAYEDIDPCVCPSRSANDCHSCDSGDSYPRNDGEYTTYANASVTDITYIHGADGVIGLEISKNGGNDKETYYYRKNIQGDVTHILDDEGIIRSQYVYDAWGNHRVLDENGDENKNDEFIGNVNPIRYRSYYYDVETKLYYLRTRYYDPVTGRFVNADSISVLDVSQTHINGLNLYAYCVNNPIMYVDAEGRWFNPFRMAADVIGGAVGFVSNAIVKPAVNSFVSAASWMNTNIFQPIGNVVNSVVEWVQDNYVTILMIAAAVAITVVTGGAGGVVGGMLLGAALGGGMSIVQQGIENGFDNINWMDVGVSALIGGAAGALTGGAGGARQGSPPP